MWVSSGVKLVVSLPQGHKRNEVRCSVRVGTPGHVSLLSALAVPLSGLGVRVGTG